MIYDRLINLSRYKNIHPNLNKAIEFIEKNDLRQLSVGKTIIDNENLFVLNMEVDTYDDKNALYEVHSKYADLHVLVDTREKYFFAYPEELSNLHSEFDVENDVTLYYKDTSRNFLQPFPGEFILFFPGEAHLPKYTNSRGKLFKIIFKIAI
ncbi:YhcH/YjgK/YiaL family protein [Mycoplasma iguanae]|uniref:YhcH/YjgK/YiaL family protein n=1 Tax=Mycoplasma iguanae TaxID=292461 RepID=A0ABY5R8Q3_9MOLU|nr:YhcH/YjgK/YiaL family protein [Mycoplasma iguanae]UVD81873.1 YhcH/YjgK/YiaL family protein [Mycoplasma iguanae]